MTSTLEEAQTLIDAELEHFGIRGMKWGVRKSPAEKAARAAEKARPKEVTVSTKLSGSKHKVEVSGGEKHPPTDDAIRTAIAERKLKKSGAHALTNDELREVATRLQLEQQVKMLQGKKPKSLADQLIEQEISKAQKDPIGTARRAHKIARGAQALAFK